MPLGTLRHNAELVKRNFINLRTAWGSLFHLLSPVSLSYYSSFHLWLFLFSPHDSLLSWFVFPLLKTIFFSCSLCHTFLHLLLSFFLWSFPLIPGHCHPQFLWSVFLGLHFSPLHFSLMMFSLLSYLHPWGNKVLLPWILHILIPHSFSPSPSYTTCYSLAPHHPANFLYPCPLATQQNVIDNLWMSLQPQEPQPWERCLQKKDWAEKKLCLCTSWPMESY